MLLGKYLSSPSFLQNIRRLLKLTHFAWFSTKVLEVYERYANIILHLGASESTSSGITSEMGVPQFFLKEIKYSITRF